MNYVIELQVASEGKTITRVRAEARGAMDVVVAVAEGKAQSVAKAVGIALEGVWDKLVPVAVIEARRELGLRRPFGTGGEDTMPVVAEGPVIDTRPILERARELVQAGGPRDIPLFVGLEPASDPEEA